MDVLANVVGLRLAGLGRDARCLVDGDIELAGGAVAPAAVLCPLADEDAQQWTRLYHSTQLLGQSDQSELVSDDFLLCSLEALTKPRAIPW